MSMVLLNKALQIDSESYNALALLGRVYLTLGNVSKAEQLLLKSLSINQHQPVAIALMSICKFIGGDAKFINISMKQNKHLKYNTNKAALLPTIKAFITYHYELEKKSFNAHYEKYKQSSSIGNNGRPFSNL